MKSEFLIVAQKLLEAQRRPMTARQLVDLAIGQKMFSDKIAGSTPHQTMKSKLSVYIREKGEKSIFVRTKPGRFYLRHLLDGQQNIYVAAPIHPPKASEKVLVFPVAWLDEHGRFQGIKKTWRGTARQLLNTTVCQYMARLEAEEDIEHKQILTYIMVSRRHKLLAFKRGTYNRVEDFLRGSDCVGFGGHVAEVDRTLFNTSDLGLVDNVVRELSEELTLPQEDLDRLRQRKGLRIMGLLNDDSSPAGRRHFAFVFKYEVSDDRSWNKPARGEKSITQLRWENPSSLMPWDFEYWSQLCLREFYPRQVRTKPAYLIRRKAPLKPPHVLCVLGALGSGKSETTNVLKKDFGYKEVNSGKVLAGLLGVPPVPKTEREKFQKLAWKFIRTPQGPGCLAKAIWKEVQAQGSRKILIDGIRQKATLEELNKLAHPTRLGLLFVHTLPDVAYKFVKNRTKPRSSIYDFLKVREAPVEQGVAELIANSDAVLYNWTGASIYRMAIHALISELR